MKLLITGEPKAGKSTLLQDFVSQVDDAQGFMTREIRRDEVRTGFELVSSTGERALLASVAFESPVRVGKYGVDVEALDTFMKRMPPPTPDRLMYSDEIGQMQLLSECFRQVIADWLDQSDIFAGTISSVYSTDFTKQVLERDDVVLLRATAANREALKDVLHCIADALPAVKGIDASLRPALVHMASEYAAHDKFLQLRKLFRSAVRYVAEQRVIPVPRATEQKVGNSGYSVVGDHGGHLVTYQVERGYGCDCDLFNGRNQYDGRAGECSHIQSVRLLAESSHE